MNILDKVNNLILKNDVDKTEARTYGKFGKVVVRSIIPKTANYKDKIVLVKKISRYSEDNKLLVKQLHLSTSDNKKEDLIIMPQIDDNHVALHFYNYQAIDVFAIGYGLIVEIGGLGKHKSIDSEVFSKAKNIVLEMCNPDSEYNINEVIELLNNLDNEDIQSLTNEWNIIINEKEKAKKKLI